MFDILAAILLILILSPVYLIIALIIKFQDGGPAIFRHQRVGRNGELFWFFKFRSMPVNTPNVQSSNVKVLTITPFGKFIRRTNLDELPQFFNVLKGDMSLIGPRPPIPSQENLVQMRRDNGALRLRPGLTGWAQVNSYDNMPEDEKARFDGEYAASIGFFKDIEIIFKTFIYLTKKPPTY